MQNSCGNYATMTVENILGYLVLKVAVGEGGLQPKDVPFSCM